MSSSDRAWGVQALGYYRDAAPLLARTFSLVAHFDEKSPGLVELLGRSARAANQRILKEKLQDLARSKGMSIPTRADINDAFLKAGAAVATPKLSSVVKEVASETGEKIQNVALGFGLVGTVALLGVAYVLLATQDGKALLKSFIPVVK